LVAPAQQKPNQLAYDKNNLITGEIVDANIEDMAAILRTNLNIPICLGLKPLDKNKDAITLAAGIEELNQTQKNRALNDIEKIRLQAWRQIQAQGTPSNTIVDWKETRASFSVQQMSVEQLMNAVTKNYPDYRISLKNTYYVITPSSGGILDNTLDSDVNFQNKSFQVILDTLAPEAKSIGLYFYINVPGSELASTAGLKSVVEQKGNLQSSKITLKMDKPTWGDLITAMAQATTPKTVWSMIGAPGLESISFQVQQ